MRVDPKAVDPNTLVGKWVSIRWHAEETPIKGKVCRLERGYCVLEDMNQHTVPFRAPSLHSIEITEDPSQERPTFMKKCWGWMNKNKLKTLFISGVVIDFWANWYGYAIVHDWIALQAILGFFLPILNFPFIHWFIDETDIKERFKMTLVTAFSMVLGSTFMLLMIRAGVGVGTDFIP